MSTGRSASVESKEKTNTASTTSRRMVTMPSAKRLIMNHTPSKVNLKDFKADAAKKSEG